MNESVAPNRTCRFPGCERPAAPAEEGRGPAAGSTARTPHTIGERRGGARRATAAVTAGRRAVVPDDLDRPVSMARARAGEYAERVAAQVETLTATLGTVVAELRTLGDPDAAAVQIDAVTAEQQRADADAAAEDATAAADATEQRARADAAQVQASDATAAVDAL